MPLNVMDQLGAVRRVVRTTVRDGKEAHVVVATQTYDAEITDVWDALTSTERIPRWFLPISGDLRLGGRYQLEGNAGGEIYRCDAPSRLGVTWEFGDQGASWVEVTLTADRGRTTLELEHTAYVPEDFWTQFGPGAVGVGWDSALLGLASHLADGGGVTPDEALAWMASAEGRRFLAGSSASWGTAHIASGADEKAARLAQDRTTAAYTAPPETPNTSTD